MNRRCEQCGRIGIRAFTVAPACTIEFPFGQVTIPEFTVCTWMQACRRRWVKHPLDDE